MYKSKKIFENLGDANQIKVKLPTKVFASNRIINIKNDNFFRMEMGRCSPQLFNS